MEIRAGVHFGECEQMGKNLSGITVVVGARIMALGGAGDVLVSGTVAELTRGAGYGMADRGTHTLKGVGGEWKVFAIDAVDGGSRPGPLDPAEARSAEERSHEEEPTAVGAPLLVAGLAVAVLAAAAWYSPSRDRRRQPRPDPTPSWRGSTWTGRGSTRWWRWGRGPSPRTSRWRRQGLDREHRQPDADEVDPEDDSSQVFGMASAPTGVVFADHRVWVTYGFSSISWGMDVLGLRSIT